MAKKLRKCEPGATKKRTEINIGMFRNIKFYNLQRTQSFQYKEGSGGGGGGGGPAHHGGGGGGGGEGGSNLTDLRIKGRPTISL